MNGIAVSKLVTPQGEIMIPGIKELIAPVTKDEQEKFEAIHFGMKVRCVLDPSGVQLMLVDVGHTRCCRWRCDID